jgi:hypothetical protein
MTGRHKGLQQGRPHVEDRHSIIILVLIFAFALMTVRTIVNLETHHPLQAAQAADYPAANR